MIEKQKQVFKNFYNDCLLEKFEKYGDPNRNLVITALLIIFLAGLIVFVLGKKDISGITSDYACYYPQSTTAYIDVELNNKNIQKINSLTSFNIKDLPGLFSRIYNIDYKTDKRKKIDRLMNQVLGDEFSYGIWNSKGADRSLIIFPIKRESKVDPLFNLLLGKKEKLVSKTYQGFKIVTTKNKKAAYLINRERLFVADSYDTLITVINDNILHDSASLYDRKDIQKALSHVDKNRIGTVLLLNSSSDNQLLNNLTDNKYSALSGFLNGSMPTTAISIMVDENLLYLDSYTPYDESKIKKENIKKAFQAVFDDKKQNLRPDFLPQNIISYFNVSGLKNYVNLYLELSDIKAKPEFEQFKQFTKMLTTLDFDSDILEALSQNLIFVTVDSGNSKPGYAAVLSLTPKTGLVISKFVKLLQIQVPSSEISKISYQGQELNTLSSPKMPAVLCYGSVGKQLYVLGDKLAAGSVINAVNSKKSFTNVDLYNDFKKHAVHNSGITAFMDIQKINRLAPESNYLDKIKNNINAVHITADYKNDAFIGSMQFNLKNNK